MKRGIFGVLVVLVMAMSSAQAADFYVGADYGQSKANISNPFGGSTDDTSSASRFTAGLGLTKNLAVEVSYVNFGDVSLSGDVSGTPVSASASAKGLTAAAVFSVPIKSVSPFARAGLNRYDVDASVDVGGTSVSESTSGTEPFYGLGVEWALNSKLSIRAAYDRYMDVGGGSVGKTDIDVTSVGAVFRF